MTIYCPLTRRLDGDWGLIHMHLRAEGQEALHLQLSDLFDPLPAFYAWLEAIVQGLPRCGWYLHEADAHFTEIESQLIGRDVREGQALDRLRLRIAPEDTRPAFVLELSRRELVSTFYLGLREFAQSDRYTPELWEQETFGDWVQRKTGQDPVAWIEQLLARSANLFTVKEALRKIHRSLNFDALPPAGVSPSGSDEFQPFTPTQAHRDHLMRLLDRDMTGHCNNGLPWRLMHSPLIEQWLAQPQSGREVDSCPWLPPGWPAGAWRLRSDAVQPTDRPGCSPVTPPPVAAPRPATRD